MLEDNSSYCIGRSSESNLYNISWQMQCYLWCSVWSIEHDISIILKQSFRVKIHLGHVWRQLPFKICSVLSFVSILCIDSMSSGISKFWFGVVTKRKGRDRIGLQKKLHARPFSLKTKNPQISGFWSTTYLHQTSDLHIHGKLHFF